MGYQSPGVRPRLGVCRLTPGTELLSLQYPWSGRRTPSGVLLYTRNPYQRQELPPPPLPPSRYSGVRIALFMRFPGVISGSGFECMSRRTWSPSESRTDSVAPSVRKTKRLNLYRTKGFRWSGIVGQNSVQVTGRGYLPCLGLQGVPGKKTGPTRSPTTVVGLLLSRVAITTR